MARSAHGISPTRLRYLADVLGGYDPTLNLSRASTPPSSWYTDPVLAEIELQQVFRSNWLVAGRIDQVAEAGQYLAVNLAGEPIVVVRDKVLKAFYNVCRHHAAQVMPEGQGCAKAMHCPYHGWTYNLDGSLRSTPQFDGVEKFVRSETGLVPVQVDVWEQWVFVCIDLTADSLAEFLGGIKRRLEKLALNDLAFHKRISYEMECNWKVFIDNYLDGGYHVPILHKGLSKALDNSSYAVETADRFCLQSCPIAPDEPSSAVRGGDMAYYYWLYPNTMINWYEGVMDVNTVHPLSPTRCRVDFDYYFADQSEDFKQESIALAHQIQLEDMMISESVQRGLKSAGYDAGRLSPQREAGEHLFHRLLHRDLSAVL